MAPLVYADKDRCSVHNYSLEIMQMLKKFETEYFFHTKSDKGKH